MIWIISILKLALPFITTAQGALANLDANDDGWDDDLAAKLKDVMAAFVAIIGTQPAGAARGYDEILQFGNNVISGLDRLIANVEMPHGEKVASGQALVDSLSDPNQVYQAEHGNDAALLVSFKEAAKDRQGVIINQPDDAGISDQDDAEEVSDDEVED